MKKITSKKKTTSKKQKMPVLNTLTNWDWTTLVAAWRYYEYRMTIASSMFPSEIVSRYFTGAYDEQSQKRIARQFVEIDHHNGEADWIESTYVMECDKKPWCMFHAFLKAYINGFKTVVLDGVNNGKHIHDEPKCFYCEYTRHWHPVEQYKNRNDCWCADEFIKEIK